MKSRQSKGKSHDILFFSEIQINLKLSIMKGTWGFGVLGFWGFDYAIEIENIRVV